MSKEFWYRENLVPSQEPVKTYRHRGGIDRVMEKRVLENNGKHVKQGTAEVTHQGEELGSDDFATCSGLVLQHEEKEDAFFMHIFFEVGDEHHEKVQELPPGKYIATPILGKRGMIGASFLKSHTDLLEKAAETGREIEMKDDFVVPTGDNRWSAAYDPKERKLTIYTREDRMIREYDLG